MRCVIRVFASLYRLRWRDEGDEREKGREAKGGEESEGYRERNY